MIRFIRRNIFLYMTLAGFVGGLLLGILYGALVSVVLFYEPSGAFNNLGGIMLGGGIYGAAFGGLAGTSMGIVDGVLMWLIYRRERLTLQVKRRYCYGVALLVTLVTLLFLATGIGFDLVFLGLPAIVATGASLLAVERYFAHYPLAQRKRKQK